MSTAKPDSNQDRRLESLPLPAVNLAARIAQLAQLKKQGYIIRGEVLILNDRLLLIVDGGKAEELGEW